MAKGREESDGRVVPQGRRKAGAALFHLDQTPEAIDHLGSVDVLSDDKGGDHDRRSYDAFGARRNPDWGKPPPASFSSETARGSPGTSKTKSSAW